MEDFNVLQVNMFKSKPQLKKHVSLKKIFKGKTDRIRLQNCTVPICVFTLQWRRRNYPRGKIVEPERLAHAHSVQDSPEMSFEVFPQVSDVTFVTSQTYDCVYLVGRYA